MASGSPKSEPGPRPERGGDGSGRPHRPSEEVDDVGRSPARVGLASRAVAADRGCVTVLRRAGRLRAAARACARAEASLRPPRSNRRVWSAPGPTSVSRGRACRGCRASGRAATRSPARGPTPSVRGGAPRQTPRRPTRPARPGRASTTRRGTSRPTTASPVCCRTVSRCCPSDDDGDFASIIRGDHDWVYRKVAHDLVAYGRARSIVRIGWEANGDWFPWNTKAKQAERSTSRPIVTSRRCFRSEAPELVIDFDSRAAQSCAASRIVWTA